MDLDMQWWITKRTSGLSMPMPKAMVATTSWITGVPVIIQLLQRGYGKGKWRRETEEKNERKREIMKNERGKNKIKECFIASCLSFQNIWKIEKKKKIYRVEKKKKTYWSIHIYKHKHYHNVSNLIPKPRPHFLPFTWYLFSTHLLWIWVLASGSSCAW